MKQQWRIPILCILASILLVIHHHIGRPHFFDAHFAHRFILNPRNELYRHLYSFGATFVLLGLVPMGLVFTFWNQKPTEWGVGLGARRSTGLIVSCVLFCLMIPVLAYASTIPSIAAVHPLSKLAMKYGKALLLYEGALLLYIAGWEFFFRGFLLFGLRKTMGDAAIYLQALPYSIMYLHRSEFEALASIPAAIILGYLAVHTSSVFYGIMLHWLCACVLDIIVIYNVF
jgi:hypothetical protein